MTRVIKFRGVQVGTDGFIYGDLIRVGNDNYIYQQNYDISKQFESGLFSVKPETVGQFTGLLDKNGKEIYEGDIVRWGMNGQEDLVRYTVIEFNPDIQFKILFYFDEKINKKIPRANYIFHYARFAYSDTKKYLEIVGNIYENEDLLNDK